MTYAVPISQHNYNFLMQVIGHHTVGKNIGDLYQQLMCVDPSWPSTRQNIPLKCVYSTNYNRHLIRFPKNNSQDYMLTDPIKLNRIEWEVLIRLFGNHVKSDSRSKFYGQLASKDREWALCTQTNYPFKEIWSDYYNRPVIEIDYELEEEKNP